MKKDLPENVVEDIAVAVVLMNDSGASTHWKVYLLNQKNTTLNDVLISSKGYGEIDNKAVKTSVLRHSIGNLPAHSYAAIEAIDPAVFGLTNEYWVSYYIDGTIYDKKYVFLPESIVDTNLIRIPIINKPGIMIR